MRKMVDLGSNAKRDIEDIALTRYACYLIAQNGDPTKDQIRGIIPESLPPAEDVKKVERRLYRNKIISPMQIKTRSLKINPDVTVYRPPEQK
jgi:hypothetical protein